MIRDFYYSYLKISLLLILMKIFIGKIKFDSSSLLKFCPPLKLLIRPQIIKISQTITILALISWAFIVSWTNYLCQQAYSTLIILSTSFTLYLLFVLQHALKLYVLARSFISHFSKYLLLKLIYHLVYIAGSFCFKILVIQQIELVPVNIIINKLVLYGW